MNRLFKKVVSSVLAAAMMVGSVTVANVSSVFAADVLSATAPSSSDYDDTYTTITQSNIGTKYSYDFGAFAGAAIKAGLNPSSTNYNFTITDGTVTGGSSVSNLDGKYFYGLSETAGNLQVVKGSSKEEVKYAADATAIYFTVADNCTAEMTITTGASGGAATVTDSNSSAVTATDGTYSLSSGTYTVKRSSKLYLSKIEITVKESGTPTPSISLDNETLSLKTGGTATLTATTKNTGDATVSWSSSDTNVATVDGGVVTAVSAGTTTITASVTVNGTEYKDECAVTVKDASAVSSCDFWFDTASSITTGTYDLDGGKVELFGDFVENGTYSYDNHTSYHASNGLSSNQYKALDANDGTINANAKTVPAKGNAFSFTPAADGILTVYAGTGSGKSYSIYDGTTLTTPSTTYTLGVTEGTTYYVFANSGTGATEFIGFEYVVNEPVEVSFAVDDADVLGTNTITATDNKTSEKVTVNVGGTTTVYAGHEYTLICSDASITTKINGSDVFTASKDTTSYTINVVKLDNVTLSGTITGVSASAVTKLGFVNNITSAEYVATVDTTAGTYSVELPKGDYTTSYTTTNGATTINRVTVGDGGKSDEEVYFVSEFSKTSYDATTLNSIAKGDKTDSMVAMTGFSEHTGGHGPSAGSGAKIAITVPSAANITVLVSYSGDFTITGKGTTVSAATASNGTTASATYKAPSAETATVTINATSYVKEIVIEPISEVDFTDSISVPGDYDTLTEAVSAIKSMSDRPDGEDGIVTINLTADIEEQVNVDASNIVIKGNGHTLTWYYALGGSYYSVDSNGYYNEELFRDKYSKNAAATSFWGGVLILNGSNIRVEDLTIKNTFNYEVTATEVADGVERNSNATKAWGTNGVRTLGTNVKKDVYRERALAVATIGDNLEFYNCSILSSQDTLGYNGSLSNHSYFKNCTIGGNVDYICGAGSMFFDNCKLEWFDDGNSTGYITAPKTNPYLFFNCEITGASLTNGLYGRPWDKNAQAIFVNTQTNGKISATGYANWSDSQTAANAKFKEYANKSGSTAFATSANYDDMTDEEYNSLISGLESTYFGSWTPKYYVPSVVTGVATTKAVIDDTTYQVVYGYVNADDVEKVDTVGYELSTADNLFGKTTAEVNTVYGEVTYTGTDGAEQTINGNGKYIAIIAIEADTASGNLYARTYSSNDNGKAYGELSVSSLN